MSVSAMRPFISSPIKAALRHTSSPFVLSRQLAAPRNPFANRINTAAMSSISEVITKDHREIEQYYNEVINSSDHDHQERFGNQFTWELARHSVAEELIVYPAFEKHMGSKGHEMAESDRKDHHRVSSKFFPFHRPYLQEAR
jgi:hypothetical protein